MLREHRGLTAEPGDAVLALGEVVVGVLHGVRPPAHPRLGRKTGVVSSSVESMKLKVTKRSAHLSRQHRLEPQLWQYVNDGPLRWLILILTYCIKKDTCG